MKFQLFTIVFLISNSITIIAQVAQELALEFQQISSTNNSHDQKIELWNISSINNNNEDEEILDARREQMNNLRQIDPQVPSHFKSCKLSSAIKTQIKSYKTTVTRIVQEITKGSFKTKAYDDLATFVDKFGSRHSGSNALERALNYLERQLKNQGLENVHEEPVKIPKWTRAYECAELLEPWPYQISSIAGYYSVGTPPGGVTAELVVIFNQTELTDNPEKVKGKIVLCNDDYICASKKLKELGALARIKFYEQTLGFQVFHRYGGIHLENPIAGIPITYINGADKDMFARMAEKELLPVFPKFSGTKMVMKYELQVSPRLMLTSKNIIGDYPGSTKRQEIVSIAAHTDSWDVGQGAQDDGFGIILALEALKLFKSLNLFPKRTIRVMFWTTEELDDWGSKNYITKHTAEIMKNWQVHVQADAGCFNSTLLIYNGSSEFACIIYEIYELIYESFESSMKPSRWPNEKIASTSYWSSDSDLFTEKGIPTVGLESPNSLYESIYHTPADTMLKINANDLDMCSAIYSAVVYVLADIDMKMPRTKPSNI